MNRILHIILFSLSLLGWCNISAQNSQLYNYRKIKLNVIEKIDEYETACKFSSLEKLTSFKNLFLDSNSSVLNDIMPDNNPNQQLKLQQYISLIDDYYEKPIKCNIEIYNISNPKYIKENYGLISADIIKVIKWTNKEFNDYIDTFTLKMEFTFDLNSDTYKINSIKSTKINGRYIVLNVFKKNVFQSKAFVNDTLLINDQPIILNNKGRFIIKLLNDNSLLKVKTLDENLPDVKLISLKNLSTKLKTFNGDKNTVVLKFREPILFIEPQITFPFNLSSVSNKEFGVSNNLSLAASINLGVIIWKNKLFYLNAKTGAGMSSINYTLTKNEISTSYYSTDRDQSEYLRTNSIMNIQEQNRLTYIPLNFMVEFGIKLPNKIRIQLPKNLYAFLDVGISFFLPLNGGYDSKAFGKYSGYYKDLYKVTMDTFYDFGRYNLQNNHTLSNMKSFYTLDLAIGLKYALTRKTSALFGIKYQYSFQSIFNTTKNQLSSNSKELNSVTEVFKEFNFQYVNFVLGLSYKL